MKKTKTFLELLNMSSENYKQKVAINKCEKYSINYFSYKFEVMALIDSIERLFPNHKKMNVAIISENRPEWIQTYLANIIEGNNVIIIQNNIKSELINKVINKYQIDTIFYSKTYKEKIIKIIKDRKSRKNNVKLNLISFDSEKEPTIINYKKIMNMGRYIENNKQVDFYIRDEGETVFVTHSKEMSISAEEIIENSLKIKKRLHIWSIINKRVIASQSISNQYDICIQIVIPLLLGMALNYNLQKCKLRDIVIQKSNFEGCEICRRKIIYKLWQENGKIMMSVNKRKKLPQFEVITNKEFSKINKSKYQEDFILIKQ